MPFADTSCLAHVALSRYEYEKGIAPQQVNLRKQSLFVFASLVETRKFYLFENLLTVLYALFWAFVRRVAVYLLRTVESSGLLYAAGATLPYDNHFCFIRVVQSGYWMKLVLS